MITTNPLNTDNYMNAVNELEAIIAKQADEIERLREALRKIADMDYRGNAHPSANIARDALKDEAE